VTRRPLPDGGWVATHDDITERCQAEAQIAYMTHYDTLTDLPNRALFMKRLEAALARVGRGEHVLILHLDLAHFKTINDTLGNSTGDQLLKLVAGRLQSCVRETDTVARLGSDEFAILRCGTDHSLDADALARRVRESIAAPCEGMGNSVILDAAIGITMAPAGGVSADQLLSQAHLALSEAKLEGVGIRYFEAGMHARARARRTLEVDLRNALTHNEFELYYQPLLNLQRNEVSGCEALLRWYHPRRGLISPGEFIPVAEDTSFIVSLGEWVLRTACREATSWPSPVSVAVNVSPIQLREPNLGLLVASILAQTGLSPHRLEIEVTEAVLMRDNPHTIANLNHLRALGVRIAMDDFGTGYSSLSYLRNFAFDKIKIDRSFIKDIAEREDARAIVQAVTTLADRMGIVTVAEGVETQSQLETSRALGCTEIQGYLFSPPKNAGEIARLLNGHGEGAGKSIGAA
jgi:diguanylate cyclase (GGDEF)-like protein